MTIKVFLVKSMAFLLAVMILFSGSQKALAAEPEALTREGIAAAEGPWLDEGLYADGSEFENPPTDVRAVRIGLRYGENAEYSAQFYSSLGFNVGYYDGDRWFFAEQYFEETDVVINIQADGNLCLCDMSDGAVLYVVPFYGHICLAPAAGYAFYGGNSYLGGFDCFINDNGLITVVNCVELEDYVKGVVPYEMAADWPLEALKAQAVCARTYVVYNQDEYSAMGFDITATEESQVYRGTTWATELTDQAVEETTGELVRWQGEVCRVYYSAADGGATEDVCNVFTSDKSYLSGKIDPFEEAIDYPTKEWSIELSREAISFRLHGWGYNVGSIKELTPVYSRSGNVIAIEYEDVSGNKSVVSGRYCYNSLGLYSCHFEVEETEMGYRFTGSGLGHSCGMSQWGAKAMAEVYGYDYQQILRFYFTGAYVA